MIQLLRALCAHGFVCLALVGVASGVWCLEWAPGSLGLGYSLLFVSAAVLVVLPRSFSLANISRAEWQLLGSAALLLLLVFALKELSILRIEANPGPSPLLPVWGGAALAVLVLSFCIDRAKGLSFTFHPIDAGLAAIFFLLALAVRAVGPDTLVGDEFIHTHNVLMISEIEKPWVLGAMGDDGYPYVLLYLQMLLFRVFASVTDVVTFQKWLSLVSGALSVGFWYLAVRLYSGRFVALCASTLLVCFGWHWVNSRFIYAYPLDLAVIAFGFLSLTVALRRGSALFAALAGFCVSAAFILQKGGVILVPVFGLLFVERLVNAGGRERRSLLALLVVAGVAWLIGYQPFLIQHLQGHYSMPLQAEAARIKAELLPKLGFSPYSAVAYMFWDAAKQIHVSINDFPRHMFRPRAPILDPVFSVIFAVGVVQCLRQIRRSQVARLCLAGLVLFILPMAISFPLNDPDRGVGRRMIGMSFFLAWVGALGAERLARRVITERGVPGAAIAFCGISAISNIWMYFSHYRSVGGVEWYAPAGRGLQSKAMINLALEAEASRIPTIVLEGYEATMLDMPDAAVRHSSSLTRVSSIPDLRNVLLTRPQALQLVVMPWDTATIPRDSQGAVQELSDIIPPFLWIAGPPDQDGIPMVRYAYVRLKK